MAHPVEAAAQAAFTATGCFETIRETKDVKVIRAELNATASQIAEVIEDLETNHKRQFIKMRKNLRALSNVIAGLQEGVKTRTIGHRALRETCDEAKTKFLPSLAGSIKEEISRRSGGASKATLARADKEERELNNRQKKTLTVLHSSVSAATIKQAVDYDAVTSSSALQKKIRKLSLDSAHTGDRSFNEARDRIEQLDTQIKLMGSELKTGFKMFSLPTIPIFKKHVFTNLDMYKQAGIHAQELEGYPILFNQPVLAFRKSYAEKLGYTSDKFVEFAEVLLEMMKERSNLNLQIVCPKYKPNPNNSDVIMIWTMPPKQLTMFVDRIAKGATGDMDWGFPTLS